MIKDYRTVGDVPQMGRNLFVKADTYLSTWGGTMFAPFSNFTESGYSSAFDFVGTGGFEVRYLEMDLMDGQEYTLAFDFTTPDYTQYTAGQGIRLELRKDISDASNINSTNIIQTKSLPYTAGTTRQTFTFTAPSSKVWICINFGYVADAQVTKRFTFANFKMEFGPTATAWTAAPEDSINLVRNSSMLKDASLWINNSANSTVSRDPSVLNGTHPSIKVRTTGSGFDGGRADGYTIPFTVNTTYTISLWAYRDSSSPDGDVVKDFRVYMPEYNGSTLVDYRHYITVNASSLPDRTWKKFTATFTTSATGTRFNAFQMDYNGVAGTACVWLSDIKVEKAATATAWTAAPEDVLIGLDRLPISIGQKTIVDWNDSLNIQAMISSNQPLTQKYDQVNGKFMPDYKTDNLILTASLFKANDPGNIIGDGNVKSIKWFRKTPKDAEMQLSNSTYYTVNGKTLTRKDNFENDYAMMEFRVEIVYTDPVSGKDVLAQNALTFNISIDAGALIQAVMTMNGSPILQNGQPVFTQSEAQDYGKNLLINSSFRSNATGWSNVTGRIHEMKSGFNSARVDGAFNTSKLTSQSLMGKIAPGETYTVSGWVLCENIVKGTTNSFHSIYLEGSYNNAGTATWFFLGSADINTSATGWVYYSKAFVADAAKVPLATSMTISSYLRDFTGTVWFRDFKLEKGSVATPWSMAPADRPVINQAEGQDKWLWRRYQSPAKSNARLAPTYDDIKKLDLSEEKLVSEGVTLYNGTEFDYYYGYLGTAVYVPEARTLPITFSNDDTVSIYVNNQVVYTNTTTLIAAGSNPVTLNLVAGWNTLEILYYEIQGGDGIWNLATSAKQVLRDAANLDSYLLNPGAVKGEKQPNGLYRFPLVSGMTDITSSTSVGVLQGSIYTMSFLCKTDSTDLTFGMVFSDGTNQIYPMSVDVGITHSLSTNGSFSPIAIDMGNGLKKVYATFTANNSIVKPFKLQYFSFTNGTYFDIGYPKLELGSVATEFSKAPEDVAPSILKTHVEKVNVYYASPFETYLQNLTLTCKLYRASVVDETDITYQWYKKDDTALTDQGAGIGWLKLTASSLESGYNLQTLVVPGNAVDGTEVYKCMITDTDSYSNSYNKKFEATSTVVNITDPIQVQVSSTTGDRIHNGQGGTTLTAKVFRNDIEIDMTGTEYTYKWYRYNKDGVKDTTWNTLGYKSGKYLEVTSTDILEKATFSVEVED